MQAADPDYLDFQKSVNANVRSGARTRHQIILRKLFAYAPAFAEVFDPAILKSAGFSGDVTRYADRINDLVISINAAYKAKEGSDLFKMTNRAAASLANLGKLVEDVDTYESLVTHLYVLLHEGPGDRLAKRPPTFADVNTLRTAAQHDRITGSQRAPDKKRWQLGRRLSGTRGRPRRRLSILRSFPLSTGEYSKRCWMT